MVMTAARRRGFTAASASLCLLFATASSAAAVAVHTLRTDLKPLIRAASESPAQFAVLLPHAVSSADGGTWSSAGGQATWRYAVQVPTAVSMSFHAVQVSLPASATLIVRGATTTTSYRARDLHRGELWSRIQPGAGLEFTLTQQGGFASLASLLQEVTVAQLLNFYSIFIPAYNPFNASRAIIL